MTRRQRNAAPTVPAPVPTLAEAAAELRGRHTSVPVSSVCGRCRFSPEMLTNAHAPCTWDRCACFCRTNVVIGGKAQPSETTQPIKPIVADDLTTFL